LGGYLCGAPCTALAYDSGARYVFVGDYSGQISVLKLDSESGVQFVNVLKGQNGSVQCLSWEGDVGWLFSGEEGHNSLVGKLAFFVLTRSERMDQRG